MNLHRLPLHVLKLHQSTCAQRCAVLRQRIQQTQADIEELRQRYAVLTRVGADLRIAIDHAVASSWNSHLQERWRDAADRRVASAAAEAELEQLIALMVEERQRYVSKIADLEAVLESDRRLRRFPGSG